MKTSDLLPPKLRAVVLTCLMVLTSITAFSQIDPAPAQSSVSQLRSAYTGNTTWNASTGVLTFTSNGTISFNGRQEFTDNIWHMPTNVKKVVIKANVRVTGQFTFGHNVDFVGENKLTSVVYGTPNQAVLNQAGLDRKYTCIAYSSFYGYHNGEITIENLTCLNPLGFMFTGKGTIMHLINVQGLDDRGGHHNHSDGISAAAGSTVKDCYFETGDDCIKVYNDILVENTHIHMVTNCVPIQLGWGNTGYDVGTFKNLTISGTKGRGNPGPVIGGARGGSFNKDIIINGCDINNPNGALIRLKETNQSVNLTITNACINLKQFQSIMAGSVTSNICGSTVKKATYNCCSGNAKPNANAGPNQTVTDVNGNGSEVVTLNGSGSSDSDGTISSYVWTEGGSQIATGVSPNVTLSVGVHNITLTVTDNDGATDTDEVRITVNAGSTGGIDIPGVVQAEDFSNQQGVQTENTSDVGGGQNVGWIGTGDWMDYNVDVNVAGTYQVDFRVASNSNSIKFDLKKGSSVLTSVNSSTTGGWQNWKTVSRTIELVAGEQTLRVLATGGGWNINWMEFTVDNSDNQAPTVPSGLSASNITETSASLSWNASSDNVGVAGYKVFQDGSQVANVSGTSASISGLSCNSSYNFTVSAYDAAGNESAKSGAESVSTAACAPAGDYIFIGHVASGNRLGATTGSVDTRSSSNSGAYVQWEQVDAGSGFVYLVNVGTGQKLNAPTNQTINMVGASTTANTAQWKIISQGGGEFFIQSRQHSKYFHIAADGSSDISLKWNTNLAGIVWTMQDVPKSAITKNEMLTAEIYPNPARTEFNITVPNNSQASYRVVSLIGATVAQGDIYNGSALVNVSDLNNGVYVLQIKQGAKLLVEKINIKK